MSYHARKTLTPGASRKRKESEAFFASTSAKPLVRQTAVSRAVSVTKSAATTSSKGAEPQPQPLSNNRLLAGYLANEFLTKGTLFGQKFDPARAEALPVSPAELKRNRSHVQPSSEAEPSGKSKPQSYAEVANLLKGDGAHIPGVVNPTQLARWIQM
ncbi:hypothetical protein BUALT_Bualt14G0118200 [Buddleja alternifolia]|uniref:Embryo sac development arrest 6 n=1 Tax=Buddleja alternifolia TaxID=168488 RepID=A0AAV6WTX0_9LAMI|nr:hypothetical protein BUALT_Bualt14G0118200 [Buddleja alternifolia]